MRIWVPNKVCRYEDSHVLQVENDITRMKEKNFHPHFESKPEHPVHHPHLSQGGTLGLSSGK